MYLTMDIVERALRDEWELPQVIAARLGVTSQQLGGGSAALLNLVVHRRVLRRETRPGNCRYEYRLP